MTRATSSILFRTALAYLVITLLNMVTTGGLICAPDAASWGTLRAALLEA